MFYFIFCQIGLKSSAVMSIKWFRYDIIAIIKLLYIFQGLLFQKCPLSRPYDSKDKQNLYQLKMLMSLLKNLNNSNKLQLDSSETTKLVPVSNQDISLVEPRKKCKLRKFLIILLLIIGSGMVFFIYGRNCCQFFLVICPHEAGFWDPNYTLGVDFLEHDFL